MIEVEHLSKVYGSTTAIQDLSFEVEPGEILGLLGPNGAGKTTTMRILSGYLPATGGTARIAGYEVHTHPMAVRQQIGYLPETPPLYPDMTVEGFLNFVARIKGVAAGDRPHRLEAALKQCSLLEKRQVLIRKLSKGFRQRVGIAQAIVHDPPVIILDEPTVGLDPRQIIEVRNLIKSLAGNKTMILSTHILPEVSMTCNRVAIINRGQLVGTGSLETLMAQLTGGAGYELEVEGNPSAIAAQLRPLPGIQALEWLSGESLPANRSKLRVISEPGVDLGRDLAAAVVQAGLGLYELRRTGASLEDVFLKLTMADPSLASTEQPSEAESEQPSEQPSQEQSDDAGAGEAT